MRTESLTHTFTARLPLLVPSCRSLISCTCNVTTDPVSLRVCVFLSHTLVHKGREQRATIILWVWDNGRAVQMWCEGLWGEWYGHTHSYNLLAGDVATQPSSEIRGVTPGKPSWALAWILSAKGVCQPAGLFRCHRRVCVCVWVFGCVHKHTLTYYVLRMNVSYQEDIWAVTKQKVIYQDELYSDTIARQNWLQKKLDVTNPLWMFPKGD